MNGKNEVSDSPADLFMIQSWEAIMRLYGLQGDPNDVYGVWVVNNEGVQVKWSSPSSLIESKGGILSFNPLVSYTVSQGSPLVAIASSPLIEHRSVEHLAKSIQKSWGDQKTIEDIEETPMEHLSDPSLLNCYWNETL